MTIRDLFQQGQAGLTVYSPDCTQSRLWGNLDHAIHAATGFQPIFRQWINHDINSIVRFYSGGDDDAPTEQDPEVAAKKYENIPAEELKYGHLVVRLFLFGPSLLTIWRGENVIDTLLALKGTTHPASAGIDTIRGRFWCDSAVCNLLHTSDDLTEAECELRALHISPDREPVSVSLIEPIPTPSYAAHCSLSVMCDVVNRHIATMGEGEKIDVRLPASGDAHETHRALTQNLREAAERTSPSAIAHFINAYLSGEVVTVTRLLKRMPVTKWEHFVIQCGTITRDQWNSASGVK